MGLEIRRRVHVAILDDELEPAAHLNPDAIRLLAPAEADARRLCDRLARDGVEVEVHRCDVEDLYAVFDAVARIATRNDCDDVYVNVSNGPTVASVGASLACMATTATAYHAAEATAVVPPEAAVETLPSFGLDTPRPEQVAVLEFVDSHSEVTKKAIIDFAIERGLPFITNSTASGTKGRYRLLETNIVRPLRETGYIRVRPVGRQKRVTITGAGRNALRAFGYLLDAADR